MIFKWTRLHNILFCYTETSYGFDIELIRYINNIQIIISQRPSLNRHYKLSIFATGSAPSIFYLEFGKLLEENMSKDKVNLLFLISPLCSLIYCFKYRIPITGSL